MEIQKGLRNKAEPNFEWEVTLDEEDYCSRIGCFKISSVGPLLASTTREASKLVWGLPSTIMKSLAVKEAVWKDLEGIVIPALKAPVTLTKELAISDKELQVLLSKIGTSNRPFVLVLSDGRKLGLNTNENVDLSVTSGDVASCLGAMWVFGAKAVQI